VRKAGYVLVLCAGCSTTGPQVASRPAAPPPPAEQATSASAATPADFALQVHGMACPLCATNVRKSLERSPGVRAAAVDLGAGVVRVSFKPGAVADENALKSAVAAAGFTARSVEAAP